MDGLTLTAAPTVAEGLANYDTTRRRASQKAVRDSRLIIRLTNEQRHPWLRDNLVTGIGRLLSTHEPTQKPAPFARCTDRDVAERAPPHRRQGHPVR